MNKKAFIISVRSRSSRLPEKCFRSIYPGLSMTEFIIKKCLLYDKFEIILATTIDKSDDYLIELANYYKIKSYRGSEEDKIKRWVGACNKFEIDTMICCDGDDPFIDLKIGEESANLLEDEKACIVESINLPCGSFTYAISVSSLIRISESYDTSSSEMMNYFFKKDKVCKYLYYDPKLSYDNLDVNNIRVTVDFIEDIRMARELIKILKDKNIIGTAQEIINLYREKPDIFSINQHRQIEFIENQQKIVDTYKS